jgi:hypothetical protein
VDSEKKTAEGEGNQGRAVRGGHGDGDGPSGMEDVCRQSKTWTMCGQECAGHGQAG